MPRIVPVPIVLLLLALIACSDPVGSGSRRSPLPRVPGVEAALAADVIERQVPPQATDAAITAPLDPHLVWMPEQGHRRGRLFLYLASSRVPPSVSRIVQREAALVGYHVIGLTYPNNPGLASFCPPSADPERCYEEVRLQVITGSPQTGFVNVNQPNSIDNRLLRLLQYLAATNPDEGWAQFLGDHDDIKWWRIAVGGHSQGAGHAAMIAKLRLVDRVVMLSGVTDGIGGNAAAWVAPGATPPDRWYGLLHVLDTFTPSIRGNWLALGMDAFGAAVAPESSDPPYDGSHRLETGILPATGSYIAPAPHASTGVDFATPLLPDGTPLLRPAWRYMLGFCAPPGQAEPVADAATPSCQAAANR